MKRIKKHVKAIIFDMDGTIVETEHAWEEATLRVLATRGFTNFSQKQYDFLQSLSGIGLAQSALMIKKEFNLLDQADILANEAKRIANTLFEEKLEFIEGFEEFHKKLTTHLIPTSIATNAEATSLELLKRKMNLQRFFGENIYGIAEVNYKAKPHPDIFLHAADKLSVYPHECIVFEDSLFGFQAAQAAGMKCIAIKNKINQNNLSLVHGAIDTYHEAEEALLQLHKKS